MKEKLLMVLFNQERAKVRWTRTIETNITTTDWKMCKFDSPEVAVERPASTSISIVRALTHKHILYTVSLLTEEIGHHGDDTTVLSH